MKKTCTTCAAELDQNYEICPHCLTVLVPEKYPKRKIKFEKLKRVKIAVSYLVFIAFSASYGIISESCYHTANVKCYNTSLVFMMLSVCSCCISWVILGANTDLRGADSLMEKKKEKSKKSLAKLVLFWLTLLSFFLVIFALVTFTFLTDSLPLS